MGAGDLPAARATLAMFPTAPRCPTTSRRPSPPPRPLRAAAAAWRCLPHGFEIGRKYRIEAEIGRGGMASVYRAVGIDRQ